MKIKLVRIDKRLLHATVAINWSSFLNIQEIILVDPTFVNEPFIEQVMQLSLPKKTKVNICSVEQLMNYVKEKENDPINIIIIFKDINVLQEAEKEGFYFPEIQFPYPASPILIKKAEEYFNKTEVQSIKKLQEKNMKFYFQTVPLESKNYSTFNNLCKD